MKRIIPIVLVLTLILAISVPAFAAGGGVGISTNTGPKSLQEDIELFYSNHKDREWAEHMVIPHHYFEDPHEAFDDLYETGTPNNWFYGTVECAALPSTEVINTNNGWKLDTHDIYDIYIAPQVKTAINYTNHFFGHPTRICNQYNPVVWESRAPLNTTEENMYFGAYSEETAALIAAWWNALDAYIAQQNGTAVPEPVQEPTPTPTPAPAPTPAPTPSSEDANTMLITIPYEGAPQKEIHVSAWAKSELSDAVSADILRFNIVSRDLADLTKDINRGQFCIVLDNMLDSLGIVDYSKSPDYADMNAAIDTAQDIPWDNPPFDDLWLYDNMCAGTFIYRLWTLGIAKGVGNNHFGQFDTLTREQAATFIVRAADVIGVDLKDADIPFTDGISDWAMDGVRCCYGSGIMKGVSNTKFAAKDNLTAEQAILIALRLYELAANK